MIIQFEFVVGEGASVLPQAIKAKMADLGIIVNILRRSSLVLRTVEVRTLLYFIAITLTFGCFKLIQI